MECKDCRHRLICRYQKEGKEVLNHAYRLEDDEGQYTPFRSIVVCDCFELDDVEAAYNKLFGPDSY